jgi:hypothetical protein
MTNSGNNMTIGDLEHLLDVYGSDRARWPIDARSGAGQLAARDRAARRLLGEAEALDRLLERAPLPSLAREAALADRIIAAAQRSPRIVHIEESRSDHRRGERHPLAGRARRGQVAAVRRGSGGRAVCCVPAVRHLFRLVERGAGCA